MTQSDKRMRFLDRRHRLAAVDPAPERGADGTDEVPAVALRVARIALAVRWPVCAEGIRKDHSSAGAPRPNAAEPHAYGVGASRRASLAAQSALLAGRDRARATRLAFSAVAMPAQLPSDFAAYLRGARVLADSGRPDAAFEHCELAIAGAQRHQIRPAVAVGRSLRSAVSRRLGRLPDALADASAALAELSTCGAAPDSDATILTVARYLMVLVDLGDLDQANRLLADTGLADATPDSCDGAALLFARGRLAAAYGGPADGLPDLFRCGERLAAWRADNPAVLPWRSEAALALSRSAATESAARLAAEEVELARRWGTADTLGRALRIQGLVLGGRRGDELLDEAVAVLRGTPYRLELTLALVAQGAALNDGRQRAAARRVLRSALELAERCGSPALVEQARRHHQASGGRLPQARPSGVQGLTPAELRVTALAAGARTNRQIAAELFLSVRTIEIHLTNAYRKLGIAGRAQLPAALSVAPAHAEAHALLKLRSA